jgi:hypothetical protein
MKRRFVDTGASWFGRPAGLLALVLALGLIGCKSGPPYNVEVALDRGSWNRDEVGDHFYNFEVDLVGVPQSKLELWKNYSVQNYFQANNAFRRDADKYTMKFTTEQRQPQTLSRKHPIWDTWLKKGATHLVVLANLRDWERGLSDDLDPRRTVINLNHKLWKPENRTLTVVVKSSSVTHTTTPHPKAQKKQN